MNFGETFLSLLLALSSFAFKTTQNLRPLESLEDDIVFSEKCFEDLGCFSNGPPYFDIEGRPISLLPQDRETIGTAFYLYTSQSKNTYAHFTNANVTDTVVQHVGFQATRRSVFIIHGYFTKSFEDWMVPMKDAILDAEDANVFIVTWFHGSVTLYDQAVANSRVVGAEIALLISKLQKDFGAQPKNVYLIGHSLGAHVAGYAGKRLPNLGRITGLDPSGPSFENVDSSIRLSRTDASLVDNIHTNAAPSILLGLGTTESIGDIDFFVNGGSHQPGCPDILDAVKELSISNIQNELLSCSHSRSLYLMISSIKIRDCFFVNLNCNSLMKLSAGNCGTCGNETSSQADRSCVEMGFFADEYKTEGHLDLYVNTTDNEPYCTRMTER